MKSGSFHQTNHELAAAPPAQCWGAAGEQGTPGPASPADREEEGGQQPFREEQGGKWLGRQGQGGQSVG